MSYDKRKHKIRNEMGDVPRGVQGSPEGCSTRGKHFTSQNIQYQDHMSKNETSNQNMFAALQWLNIADFISIRITLEILMVLTFSYTL